MHFALRSEFRPFFLFGSSCFHLFHIRTEERLLTLMGLFGCGFGLFGGLCVCLPLFWWLPRVSLPINMLCFLSFYDDLGTPLRES